MKVVLDSNRYTDLMSGVAEVVEFLLEVEAIYVPLIVLGELRAGFANGSKRQENERKLALFLAQEAIFVLRPDEATTYFYADLYAQLRRKGTPIPSNDLWIAALTVQHNLVLFDRDSDFDRVPQLARVGPLNPRSQPE